MLQCQHLHPAFRRGAIAFPDSAQNSKKSEPKQQCQKPAVHGMQRVPLLHCASFRSWIIKFHHSTCMVFHKRILNKGLGTIFQSFLVGIKVASDIQTEQFSATEFDLFSSCQALSPESTSWRSFDSPIHRKLVKNLHHQKVSVKSVATPWEHTSSRYRTSTVNRLTQAD